MRFVKNPLINLAVEIFFMHTKNISTAKFIRGFLTNRNSQTSESWISMMRGRIDLGFFLFARYTGILASLKKSAGCDKFPRRCAGWSSLPPPVGRSFNNYLHMKVDNETASSGGDALSPYNDKKLRALGG